LKDKRGKENFHQTVRKCFSRQVITTERVRLFSQRAQAYILAYQKIRQEQLTCSSAIMTDTASPVNVEMLLKTFKAHRCAMDFDSSFCKAVFCNDDGENVSGAATIVNMCHFFVAVAQSSVRLVNAIVLSTQIVVQTNGRANEFI
jgi:hypothetical protein